MSCVVIKVCASSKRKLFMVKPRRSKGEEKGSHSTKHCWGFGLVRRERRTGERRANQLVAVTRNTWVLGTWLWQRARWCEFGWRAGSRNGVYGRNCSGESISYRFRCQKPSQTRALADSIPPDHRHRVEIHFLPHCSALLSFLYFSPLSTTTFGNKKKTLFFSLVRAIAATVNYAKHLHFLF